MFLLGHDERTGKARMSLEILGVGLVATALAQLALDGAIYVEEGTGQVTRQTIHRQDDAAANYILEQIVKGEPTIYTVIDWITVLRDDLYTGIGSNLEYDELVQIDKAAISRSVRYIPKPRTLGEEPLAWVYGVLRSRNSAVDFEEQQRVLACICAAMGVAAAITALSPDEIETKYPKVLANCKPATIAIAKAAAHVKTRLSMTVRR